MITSYRPQEDGSQPGHPDAPGAILARAVAAASVLAQRSDEIEQARRLPQDVVELLRNTGVFRMGFAESWGGPCMSPSEQTEVIEALAVGDASAAWCAMVGMDTGIYARYLDDAEARTMFGTLDLITAGAIAPQGRADRVPGGFRVTGHWRFGSGITHCDWVVAGCLVYQDGEPEPNPIESDSKAHWRLVMATPENFDIVDTWHSTGLAGSGSVDYTTEGLFVPEARSFSFARPYVDGPGSTPDAILRPMPGVALGVARAALDHVRTQAATRVDRLTGTRWSKSYRIQTVIAEAEMDLAAARHAVYGSLRRQWELLRVGAALSGDDQVAVALARVNAFRVARTVVSTLYDLMTTSAVYLPSLLDRCLRDLNTMCQHVVVQEQVLQSAGALLLGAKPHNPFALGVVE